MSPVKDAEPRWTKGPWIGKADGRWFDPGKWNVDRDDLAGFIFTAVGSQQGIVALVVGGDEGDSPSDAASEANAHLIAAAPDLYEALNNLLEATDARGNLPYGKERDDLLNAGWLAVKQARGASS